MQFVTEMRDAATVEQTPAARSPAPATRHPRPFSSLERSQSEDPGRTTRIMPTSPPRHPAISSQQHPTHTTGRHNQHVGIMQISPHYCYPPLGLENHLPPRRHHHRHQPRRTHPALPRTTHRRGVSARTPAPVATLNGAGHPRGQTLHSRGHPSNGGVTPTPLFDGVIARRYRRATHPVGSAPGTSPSLARKPFVRDGPRSVRAPRACPVLTDRRA
jgi:hypothetical protein